MDLTLPRQIRTPKDIVRFFSYLAEVERLSFHPDKRFRTYGHSEGGGYQQEGGRAVFRAGHWFPMYSETEANRRDRLMIWSRIVAARNDLDIYCMADWATAIAFKEQGPYGCERERKLFRPDPPGVLDWSPSGPSLGVALPQAKNYWIKPDGEVIYFDWDESHDVVAQEAGFKDSQDALKNGWVRAFDLNANIGFEVWNIMDTQTAGLVAGFLEEVLMNQPSFVATIDTMIPKVTTFVIGSEGMDTPILEAIEHEAIRALS